MGKPIDIKFWVRYGQFVSPNRTLASYIYYCRCNGVLGDLAILEFIGRTRGENHILSVGFKAHAIIFSEGYSLN